jgi:hypothetical protein
MAGTSRQELIQWINDLLQLNYTKVEQCGTGAVYCQIMDSIYGEKSFLNISSYSSISERRCTNESSENEPKDGVRVSGELQNTSKHLQSEENRQGMPLERDVGFGSDMSGMVCSLY